jgi:hypothetical protein
MDTMRKALLFGGHQGGLRHGALGDGQRALPTARQKNATPCRCQAGRVFRDLIDMPATVTVSPSEVLVHFHRRAQLPIIIDSGLLNPPVRVPWWNNATLRMVG